MNRTAPIVSEPTPFKMIRTTNVRHGFIDTENVKYVTEQTYRRWTRRLVPRRGDVILTREAPLGGVGMLRTDDSIFLGQRLYHFRADPKKLDAHFLMYSLMAPDLQGQIFGFGSGATVEHMRLGDIPRLEISLPPLATQRRVGAMLAGYDELMENNARRIKILEEMAQALYREWFVDFRFPGHEKVKRLDKEIPQGWEAKKIGDIIELAYGRALKAEERAGGLVPVFGSSGVIGFHDKPLAKGPGIIVGRKGNVGSVFWTDSDFYPIDTAFFVRTKLSLPYVFYNLQHQNFINNDAAVPGLSRRAAYLKSFIVPDMETQQAFEDAVTPIFNQLRVMREKNSNLRSTRDLLLPKLISGEIPLKR